MTNKTWKEVGNGDNMTMGLLNQPYRFLRGSKDKLKELIGKETFPHNTFIYLTDEERLLWHTEDGRVFETEFREIDLDS